MTPTQVILLIVGLFITRLTYYIVSRLLQRRKNTANFATFSSTHQSPSQLNPLIATDISLPSQSSQLRVSIVLGSGGHTSEVLSVTKALPRNRCKSITYFYANTDLASKTRAEQQEKALPINPIESCPQIEYVSMPRAREVGQSYFSSVFTTLKALLFVFGNVIIAKPDLLVVNGPGSCVPVCAVVILLNLLGLSRCKIVYIESLTRIHRLSLSGFIMYPFADRFIVHWPALAKAFQFSEYLGILY
jgi:beta-1,4-N-acetylglucosaminyltransferase